MDHPFLRFEHGGTIDQLRGAVRDFVAQEISSRAAQIDASNQFPADLRRKLCAFGEETR